MCAVMPSDRAGVLKTQVGFVDQRRCLQAVAWPLMGDVALNDPMELGTYERNQAVQSVFIALAPFEKEPGDLCGLVGNRTILSRFDAVAVSFRMCSRFARRFPLLR